jgi:hypothetical protein
VTRTVLGGLLLFVQLSLELLALRGALAAKRDRQPIHQLCQRAVGRSRCCGRWRGNRGHDWPTLTDTQTHSHTHSCSLALALACSTPTWVRKKQFIYFFIGKNWAVVFRGFSKLIHCITRFLR